MSASQFNSLFTPSTTVLSSNYDFMNTPNAGVVESQVFTGTGAAAGTYAYAYQFGVNNAMDTSIQQPTSVNSASMLFNATPVGTDFTHTGSNTYAYVVTNGQVGRNQPARGRFGQRHPDPVVDRLAARLDHRFADVSVLEPDHEHWPARGRCFERHGRRHLDAAVHAAVCKHSKPGAADALSQGVLADRRPDQSDPRARACHRPGLGQRDRRRRHRAAVPSPARSLSVPEASWHSFLAIVHRSDLAPRHLSEGREGLCRFRRIWFRIAGALETGPSAIEPDRDTIVHFDEPNR